jgi:hypothetical protein
LHAAGYLLHRRSIHPELSRDLAHPRPSRHPESLLDSFGRLGVQRRAAEPFAVPTGSKAGTRSWIIDRSNSAKTPSRPTNSWMRHTSASPPARPVEDFAGAATFRRDWLDPEADRARPAARRVDLLEPYEGAATHEKMVWTCRNSSCGCLRPLCGGTECTLFAPRPPRLNHAPGSH